MMKHTTSEISTLNFTGERYMPEVSGNIELEHLHRYLLAKQVVAGKTVLDIASGEGYGSAMLAQSAGKVTGVDISQEAVHMHKRSIKLKTSNFALVHVRRFRWWIIVLMWLSVLRLLSITLSMKP